MNTRRIGKWIIVLFLLAALPGLTAVMAQDEPVERIGTSAAIPWVNTETEPNDSIGDRLNKNDIYWFETEDLSEVRGGRIDRAGDVDYFSFLREGDMSFGSSISILIDVEAESLGFPLDAVICLYSDDNVELACNDNADGHDPFLFYNLEDGRHYYLTVRSANASQGGSSYKYQLLLSTPLLISAAAGSLGTGYVDGIPFQSGDILAWSEFKVDAVTYEKWRMLLDLSDLGIKGNIANLASGWRNSDYLLLGFAANTRLPGNAGTATPWDIVLFDPSQVGQDTQGVMQKWWLGSQHGLTTSAEKLDGIDWRGAATSLALSTAGNASVPSGTGGKVTLADEDVGLWNLQPETWLRRPDMSVFPGMAAEDVIALNMFWYRTRGWEFESYLLVIQGTRLCGPAPQALVTQKDIFKVVIDDMFGDGEQQFYLYCGPTWHGPDHGWNYNIDAIDVSSTWYWYGR